ncbi:MAG: DUF2971 domain-containing protein [Methanobacterium sp.]
MWKKQFCQLFCATNKDQINVKKAMALKHENMPSSLYKYMSFDKDGHSLNLLESDELWLSSPNNFNDPFDSGFTFNYGESASIMDSQNKNQREDLAFNEKRIKNLVPNFNSIHKNRIFERCFSEEIDSTPMWSHYADDYKGFCIEYNFKQFEFGDDISTNIYPVIYNKKLFDATKHLRQIDKLPDDNILMNICAAINKSIKWSNEKEWRIVSIINEGPLKVLKPKAVYLGDKVTDKHKKSVMEIANVRKIEVYQIQINATEISFEKLR